MHSIMITVTVMVLLVAYSVRFIKDGKWFKLQAKIKKAELGDLIIAAENVDNINDLEINYAKVEQLKKEIRRIEKSINPINSELHFSELHFSELHFSELHFDEQDLLSLEEELEELTLGELLGTYRQKNKSNQGRNQDNVIYLDNLR